MYQIDFRNPCSIHFIGIGGISMSGIAELLRSEGFRVSGSDMKESALTEHLRSLGIRVEIGQKAGNIASPDVVCYTAAIRPDNEELLRAKELGIPLLTRAELLGELMTNYREAVNVAGTHGKTSTTSMLADILLLAGKDPTVSIGGMLDSIGGNLRAGGQDIFLVEACEYTNSFLSFYPTVGIILNVEADHLDFFKDLDDIRKSFRKFAELLPQDGRGCLILNGDIRDKSFFTEGLGCEVRTFGKDPSCMYTARNITYDETARPSYDLYTGGKLRGRVKLGLPGEHNVWNSLAAVACADRLGIAFEAVTAALAACRGSHRRFEYKGSLNGFTVVDDYAHHPQEIAATLKTAALCPHRRLVVAFQPHTYSRTKALFDEFAKALCAADEVLLTDIYAAREKDDLGVSSALLAERIGELGTKAVYLPGFPELEAYIRENLQPGDLLITMGAGNIVDAGEELLGL